MRPGDRKQRWQSSCAIGGGIMLLIGAMLVCSGCIAGYILGAIAIFFGLWDFADAKRGWKIRYDLPPRYYRDIRSSNPIIREIARKVAESTLKEAKNPKRKRRAFDN